MLGHIAQNLAYFAAVQRKHQESRPGIVCFQKTAPELQRFTCATRATVDEARLFQAEEASILVIVCEFNDVPYAITGILYCYQGSNAKVTLEVSVWR